MCNWFLNQNILKGFIGKFWLLWFYNIKCNYSSDYNILSTNWGKCKILKIYIPQLFPIFFLTAIFWDSLWHLHAHFFRFSHGPHHTLISLVVTFLQSSSHFWFHDSYTLLPTNSSLTLLISDLFNHSHSFLYSLMSNIYIFTGVVDTTSITIYLRKLDFTLPTDISDS